MATALMVMGPQRAMAFAIEHGLAAYFIVRDGSHFSPSASPAFTRLGGVRLA
jgi:thiamine biosynthesis lipoprotein